MTIKVNFTAVLCTLAVMALALPSLSEEVQQCPDLSSHESVLNEGEAALPPEGPTGGSGSFTLLPEVGYGHNPTRIILPENVDDLLSGPYEADAFVLANYAHAYEQGNDCVSAEKVYEKILTIQKLKTTAQNIDKARTFEDLGAVMILGALCKKGESLNTNLPITSDKELLEVSYGGYVSRRSLMSAARSKVLELCRQRDAFSKLNKEQLKQISAKLKKAERCYLSALSIRSNLDSTGRNSRFAILMLAALSEWKKSSREALAYLDSALTLSQLREGPQNVVEHNALQEKMRTVAFEPKDILSGFPSASDAFVDYCIYYKNWKKAIRAERSLIEQATINRDDIPVRSLLSAYVRYKRHADAGRLFKEFLTSRTSKEVRLEIPADLFSTLAPHLAGKEQQQLLYPYFFRADTFVGPPYTLEELFQLSDNFESMGLTKLAQDLATEAKFEEIATCVPSNMTKIATFYIQKKKYAELASLSNRMISIIAASAPMDEPDCETKVDDLSKIISALKDPASDSSAECNGAMLKAEKLKAYYESEGMKLQCLQVSRELNNTGWKLEVHQNYELALKMYEESLSIKLKNLGASDPETAAQYGELARLAGAQGDFKKSENLYNQGLAIFQIDGDRSQRDYGNMLENYAMILQKDQQQAESDIALEKAKTIFRKLSEQSRKPKATASDTPESSSTNSATRQSNKPNTPGPGRLQRKILQDFGFHYEPPQVQTNGQ